MSIDAVRPLLECGFDPFTPTEIEEHIERAEELSVRVNHTGHGELPDRHELAYVMENLASIVQQLQAEFELLGVRRLEPVELATRVLGEDSDEGPGEAA